MNCAEGIGVIQLDLGYAATHARSESRNLAELYRGLKLYELAGRRNYMYPTSYPGTTHSKQKENKRYTESDKTRFSFFYSP